MAIYGGRESGGEVLQSSGSNTGGGADRVPFAKKLLIGDAIEVVWVFKCTKVCLTGDEVWAVTTKRFFGSDLSVFLSLALQRIGHPPMVVS
jgi:hypothetical protein